MAPIQGCAQSRLASRQRAVELWYVHDCMLGDEGSQSLRMRRDDQTVIGDHRDKCQLIGASVIENSVHVSLLLVQQSAYSRPSPIL